MPNIAFSEARVKAFAPRTSAWDILDAKLRGFGVRVLPAGARRFFMHTRHHGKRNQKTVSGVNAG